MTEHLDYIGGNVPNPDVSGNDWDNGGPTPDFLNNHQPAVTGVNTSNTATQPLRGAGASLTTQVNQLNLLDNFSNGGLPRRRPQPGLACPD